MALPIKKHLAKDIMTSPPITVTSDTTMHEIAALFNSRNINRVPVVDADGKVIGIVTRGNLLQAVHLSGRTAVRGVILAEDDRHDSKSSRESAGPRSSGPGWGAFWALPPWLLFITAILKGPIWF